MITPTKESLELVEKISRKVETFHHHFHILYDIARDFIGRMNYVEIGTYKGASACLMLQRPHTTVITIDTGQYVKRDEVINNLNRFNVYHNPYRYIEQPSERAISKVKDVLFGGIDILYLDGSHELENILEDWDLYAPLVNKNGYIVFDDYNDIKYNPQIHNIVFDIAQNLLGSEYAAGIKEYKIIGTIKNTLGAYCSYDIPEGNCFIIKKLCKTEESQ